eukprot:3093566-Lingulodinium_polyedra.AAC.1
MRWVPRCCTRLSCMLFQRVPAGHGVGWLVGSCSVANLALPALRPLAALGVSCTAQGAGSACRADAACAMLLR